MLHWWLLRHSGQRKWLRSACRFRRSRQVLQKLCPQGSKWGSRYKSKHTGQVSSSWRTLDCGDSAEAMSLDVRAGEMSRRQIDVAQNRKKMQWWGGTDVETEGEVVGIGESKRKRNRRKKGLHAFPKVWFNFLQAAENRRNKFKFIANECLQIVFCQINSLKTQK